MPCRYNVRFLQSFSVTFVLIRTYKSELFLLENQHNQICSRHQKATFGGQQEANRELLSGRNIFLFTDFPFSEVDCFSPEFLIFRC